jgi:hypothetical protein
MNRTALGLLAVAATVVSTIASNDGWQPSQPLWHANI